MAKLLEWTTNNACGLGIGNFEQLVFPFAYNFFVIKGVFNVKHSNSKDQKFQWRTEVIG